MLRLAQPARQRDPGDRRRARRAGGACERRRERGCGQTGQTRARLSRGVAVRSTVVAGARRDADGVGACMRSSILR
ncbi:hypothetical protein [Lysobacter gummosus]|uniref:hypothetical protein n=1 Tax=Lysobacter gummosus TaxID=262324 RepID=UPI00363E8C73